MSKTTARKQVKKLPARKSAPAAKAKASLARKAAAPVKAKPVAKSAREALGRPAKPASKHAAKPAPKSLTPVAIQRKGAPRSRSRATSPCLRPPGQARAREGGRTAAKPAVAAKHVAPVPRPPRVAHAAAKASCAAHVVRLPLPRLSLPCRASPPCPRSLQQRSPRRPAARRQGKGREDRDQAPGQHAGRPPVAAQAADRARQGTELPHLRRSQRPPAVRDRRSGADRRHRADDQRHGHPGVRKGTGRRSAADARAGRRRRRGRRRSRAGARHHGRRRVRPHHRPGPHVHARDGHGRAADARRRNRHREAHRGRPRFRAPRAVALPAHVRIHPACLRAAQGRPGPPRRHHRRLRRPERARRHRRADQSEAGREGSAGGRGRRRRRRRRRGRRGRSARDRPGSGRSRAPLCLAGQGVCAGHEVARGKGQQGPEDDQAAQEARRRVHGAQAVARRCSSS